MALDVSLVGRDRRIGRLHDAGLVAGLRLVPLPVAAVAIDPAPVRVSIATADPSVSGVLSPTRITVPFSLGVPVTWLFRLPMPAPRRSLTGPSPTVARRL